MSTDYLTALDQELRLITQPPDPRYADFFNISHYHLGWTDSEGSAAPADMGKRLRPLMCLWSCESAGGAWQTALPAAAAIELIHNFSLIHDDIQDASDTRRGRPTVWNVWGLAHGVNAGDAMFVLAYVALRRLVAPDSNTNTPAAAPDLPLERYIQIQRAFDTANLKLTQGQYLDLAYERADQVQLDAYFEMVSGKTAALIAAACEIGARVATPDPTLISNFAGFGKNLGIAFQISDDILGLWGDPELTGKSARTDLLSRKKSYPVLAALASNADLRALYAKPSWSESDLQQIENLLTVTNARAQATAAAESYARQALTALDATRLENPATTRLRDLVHQVVYREK